MSDPREVALEVLTACRKADAWVDGALKSTLARTKLDRRDAALASRLTYTVVQNRMLLDFRISKYCRNGLRGLEPVVLDILRIGACQILLMDKIPYRAAVNQAVEMTKAHHRVRASGLVNAILRNLIRERDILPPIADLSVRYSHPKWLIDTYISLLGQEEAELVLSANNAPVPTTIQRNPLLVSREELERELPTAQPHPWLPDCYSLSGAGNLEAMPAFQAGHFFVQDAAAKLVSLISACQRGDHVIDVCAAPGGKSFAMAMAMANEGEILSCDIHGNKLRQVAQGASRLGISCIRTLQADGRTFRPKLAESADVVLCDVPCSGLGIIRKKPDIRYKNPMDLSGLPDIQSAILANAAHYVKPGGTLIYSTCTILPQENEHIVQAFLRTNLQFQKESFSLPDPVGKTEGEVTLWPQRHQTDGFYICKMRKHP